MTLLFGVALFLHFVVIRSWILWTIVMIIGLIGFVWSWIEIYKLSRKTSHRIVIATLLLAFVFCAPVKSPAQDRGDKAAACAVIVGIVIIAGGAYVAYKLYCSAKHLLNPGTNAPPNLPPQGTNHTATGNSMTYQIYSAPIGELDSSDLAFTPVQNTWTDWKGFPIVCYVEGTTVRYSTTTGTNEMQSSTDLISWQASPIFIRSWISSSSNVVTITADSEGNAFATNWSEQQGDKLVPVFELTTPCAIPVRNTGRQFYKTQTQ